MKIGGWQKFSLIDYPGKTCAILFTQGCNFRCRYCHNPELVLSDKFTSAIPLPTIFKFLQTRCQQLDAVTITGGEPTLHTDLIPFLQKIKQLGYLIKLDTNGTNPEMLAQIIQQNCMDYIAMDIKAPLEKYEQIIDVSFNNAQLKQIEKSIKLIINSGIQHEFRTTVVKSLLTSQDLLKIAQTIQGAQQYYLQQFVSSKLIDNSLNQETCYTKQELAKIATQCSAYVQQCGVR